MTTVDTYNLKGLKTGTTRFPDTLLSKSTSSLLAQAVHIILSNKRRGLASAMTRGESGKTTAKMYRQKHTGRARHGAKSAPIFVGGGIAHGPRGNQNYHKDFSKKMSRNALAQAFSLKLEQKSIIAVDGLEKISPKVSAGQKLLELLVKGHKNIIIATNSQNQNVVRAFGNLPTVSVVPFKNLNTYAVLSASTIVIESEVLATVKETKKK